MDFSDKQIAEFASRHRKTVIFRSISGQGEEGLKCYLIKRYGDQGQFFLSEGVLFNGVEFMSKLFEDSRLSGIVKTLVTSVFLEDGARCDEERLVYLIRELHQYKNGCDFDLEDLESAWRKALQLEFGRAQSLYHLSRAITNWIFSQDNYYLTSALFFAARAATCSGKLFDMKPELFRSLE